MKVSVDPKEGRKRNGEKGTHETNRKQIARW